MAEISVIMYAHNPREDCLRRVLSVLKALTVIFAGQALAHEWQFHSEWERIT
jgi:hypothetical protein